MLYIGGYRSAGLEENEYLVPVRKAARRRGAGGSGLPPSPGPPSSPAILPRPPLCLGDFFYYLRFKEGS